MTQVEQQLNLAETRNPAPRSGGQLLALVDTLSNGTIIEQQRKVVQSSGMGSNQFQKYRQLAKKKWAWEG